jgi:hypothetical protein
MTVDPEEINPNDIYDQFPAGAPNGFGPEQGFNRFVRLNDPELFTDAAREDPVINEFLNAPFSVTYVQLKSSTRESEYFIHKPHLAMAGQVEGIEGSVDGFPSQSHKARLGTYVINHDRTLAFRITRAMIIEDGAQAGQIIYKEGDGS